jgi:hypothetical protein
LNLSNADNDQHDMLAFLITLLVLLSGYGAYRAFRGGFQRPQSERLTGYGIIGIGVALLILLSLIDWLFPNLL